MKDAVVVVLICISMAAWGAAGPSQVTRKSLPGDTVIQNYPCAKGYAWFYGDGALNRCTLSRDATFGEAKILRGSIIELWPDGTTHYAMLAHDAVVAGYEVMGGSLLGPGEGAMTGFYPSGKLRTIYLVSDQTIQGVPCRGGEWGIFTDFMNGGNFVEFYEDGRLQSCKLVRDFGDRKRGQRIRLAR